MPGRREEEWARRVVLAKIAVTLLIASAGSLIVYLGRQASVWIQVAGLLLVALSPILSYVIVARTFGE